MVACTREETTEVIEEVEAHVDVGEAVEGEEVATTTATTTRELGQEEGDRIRQHKESTNEYNCVLFCVRRSKGSLTVALHVRHMIIDVSVNRSP